MFGQLGCGAERLALPQRGVGSDAGRLSAMVDPYPIEFVTRGPRVDSPCSLPAP
jgi:hypothetical protein